MAKYALPIIIATGLAGSTLLAMAGDHSEHDKAFGQTSAPLVISKDTPFSKLMDQSMAIMHQGMATAPATGDPDHDFASMMIPHHQGAVDMAKIELLYGTNPVLRRLAQEIIVTQNSEIELMKSQLQPSVAKDAAPD